MMNDDSEPYSRFPPRNSARGYCRCPSPPLSLHVRVSTEILYWIENNEKTGGILLPVGTPTGNSSWKPKKCILLVPPIHHKNITLTIYNLINASNKTKPLIEHSNRLQLRKKSFELILYLYIPLR